MPTDDFFRVDVDPELLANITASEVWTAAVRGGFDTATEITWDPRIRRTSRVMVPIDVQAFVVPDRDAEETVPVTGGTDDPAPFAPGAVRPGGVHVHWAMPDALLRAADPNAGDDQFVLPHLPDRWVVLRLLFPIGQRRPFVRGWVLDAVHGTVTTLDGFSDETPTNETGTTSFEPLDGLAGGGPLWTAAYEASAGRFGLHDPLDDLEILRELAPDGLTADQATYVVAGWPTRRADDPLDSGTPEDLDDVLADLGWTVDHEADLRHLDAEPASFRRLADIEAYPRPDDTPTVEIVTPERRERYEYADVAARQRLPFDDVDRVIVAPRTRQYASLFHGMVAGVPIGGTLAPGDDRPRTAGLQVAVALDTDDAVAAFWSAAIGADRAERQGIEQLAAAFAGGTLKKLGTDDGLREIEEREHDDGFFALPGRPLESARPDTLRQTDALDVSPLKVGRKGRSAIAPTFGPATEAPGAFAQSRVMFGSMQGSYSDSESISSALSRVEILTNPTVAGVAAPRLSEAAMAAVDDAVESRTVVRPAPRMFRPAPPIIAIRGARPSLRHHGDGQYDDQGRLRCRFESEIGTNIGSLADARSVLPTLGSGAVPLEVLTVAQEAILLTPWASSWLVRATAPRAEAPAIELAEVRMNAEMLRLYSADGRYDGTGVTTLSTAPRTPRARRPRAASIDSWENVSLGDRFSELQAAAELGRLSAYPGTPPSPVGVTAWRQPWVPLWLEWEVEVNGTASLQGWRLDALDFVQDGSISTDGRSFTFSGRSPIGRGMTRALHQSIEHWLRDEEGRDADLTDEQIADLRRLEGFLAPIDVASASLDGIREQLLGIDYVGVVAAVDEDDDRPTASRPPMPFFGGTIRLIRMRLVDAFGRTLDVPVADLRTPLALEVEGATSSFRTPPRLQHGARWLLRLVDPAWDGDPARAPEAFVDQLDPQRAVNPVAGFLLPDHIDEALEAFDVDGNPLGQLSHHELTGSVRWEPAPGRPLPPGAGPLQDLPETALPIGRMASAVVRADIAQRNNGSEAPPAESPLSAMLRAIDSTLWSVDTFAALGSPSVAGLVGRPIAVVRANLTLDVLDDLAEVRITAPGGEAERRAAYDAVADTAFPVRLGDLQRSDDGLLGYFVDDDDTFRVIDRTVVERAPASGRLRGHLGLLGQVAVPDVEPIDNPWIVTDDVIWMTPGSTRRLTLLMVPGGRVHLTSGILPRKRLALQNDWITALPRIMPSVRVGPVLVDPAEIRLPKVDLLGDRQQFTRRTGPVTWRDDPIVAASQSALLPRTPHEIQEGWIRIREDERPDGATS